jgi:hypothetical protein
MSIKYVEFKLVVKVPVDTDEYDDVVNEAKDILEHAFETYDIECVLPKHSKIYDEDDIIDSTM